MLRTAPATGLAKHWRLYPRNSASPSISTTARATRRKLAEAAKACDGIVLISWQHEYMAALATAILGDAAAAPPLWPKNRFDLIWIFTLDNAAGRYAFAQMPQMLLAGDSP